MARIGSIVPHLLNFGGIRRFLEIGNEFEAAGHTYTIFVEKFLNGIDYPDWFGDFRGRIKDWSSIEATAILIGDPPSLKILPQVKGSVYVYVIGGDQYTDQYRAVYGDYPFILNNRVFAKTFPRARIIEGGVNTSHFSATRKLVVGYQSGRGPNKGEAEIIAALSHLENVKLRPIEGVDNSLMPFVYGELDYFVVNQKHPGWPNMAVEALACHCPVISMVRQSMDPIEDRVIFVDDLEGFFARPMEHLSWQKVAKQLLEVMEL
jgi:hypothetical protein